MSRLASELDESPAMFHAIFAAYIGDDLAGIGAITDEPERSSIPAWRMRRLYVRRRFRRRGAARAIAVALIRQAIGEVRMLTVNAGSEQAAKFWEQMGFHRVGGKGWSHEKEFK